MRESDNRIDELSVEQREKLIELLRLEIEQVQQDEIKLDTFISDDGKYPLSYAQQGMWFVEKLNLGTPIFNDALISVRLNGELQIEALTKAIQLLIDRQQVLRLRFHEVDHIPYQQYLDEVKFELPIVDLSHLHGDQQETINQYALEEANQPFDLVNDPPFRIKLIKISDQEHVLFYIVHHIISDGTSTGIFMRELASAYNDFCSNQTPELPELKLRYTDYSVWESKRISSPKLQNQLQFWKNKLANIPDAISFAGHSENRITENRNGKKISKDIPSDVYNAILEISQKEQVTLNVAVLTLVNLLIYKYTGTTDIVLGSPITARTNQSLDHMMGCFVNTTLYRSDLSRNPPFCELIHQVRDGFLETLSNQDVPIEVIAKEFGQSRDSALFNVMYGMQHEPSDVLFNGLSTEATLIYNETTKYDLIFSFVITDQSMRLLVQFATPLFAEDEIERLVEYFNALVMNVLHRYHDPIDELSILSTQEKNKLLLDWGQSSQRFNEERLLHEWFEQQVVQSPDATAIVLGEASLTFKQLNEKANQIAHYLIENGVSVDTKIGLYMRKSLDYIVCILAVLKAGGAYVPLDTKNPWNRIQSMIDIATIRIVIVNEQAVIENANHDLKVMQMNEIHAQTMHLSKQNPESVGNIDHTAYVVFTSGSTGAPKGVEITHGNITNYVRSAVQFFGMHTGHHHILLQALTTDFCKTALYGSLLSGGCLHLILEDDALDAKKLASYISSYHIDWMKITPSHLRALEHNMDIVELLPKHGLIFGGEASSWEYVRNIHKKAQTCSIYNHYGPSETTVGVLMYKVTLEDAGRNYGNTPLGTPVGNSKLYVLDDNMQPVPIGIAGTLYVEGKGVARGYINAKDLTEQRFKHVHFDALNTSKRLYNTGDIVKYLPDGNLEFIGRSDDQLKIRGYRVEPDEIKHELMKQSFVHEAVIFAKSKDNYEHELTAFIVPQQDCDLPEKLIREQVRSCLTRAFSDYMIPKHIIVLASIPLTASGKIDRNVLNLTLENIQHSYQKTDSVDQLPEFNYSERTNIIEILCGLYEEIIGLKNIKGKDHFFKLGGHSLLVTKLVSRIRKTLKTKVGLRTIFKYPVVDELADEIIRINRAAKPVSLQAIQKVQHHNMMEMSFAQERVWFLHQLSPKSCFYNLPIVVQIEGELQIDALQWSINQVVERHEALRTVFPISNEKAVQSVKDITIDIKHVQLEGSADSVRTGDVQNLVEQEIQLPFSLEDGPLIRITLIKTDENKFVLCVVMHHIIADGWSISLLLEELERYYTAYIEQEDIELDSPLQYADYSLWQRQWMDSGEMKSQLDYWKAQLRDAPSVLELPTDRQRQPFPSFRGGTKRLDFPVELAQSVKEMSRAHGVSNFITLLSAFHVLLYSYSKQSDILVGVPVSGRDNQELNSIFGFFVNTIVIRSTCASHTPFTSLLNDIRATTLDAFQNQDYPFEKIVAAICPERSSSHNALYQVAFTYQNDQVANFKLGELAVQPFMYEWSTSKVDLTLLIIESSDSKLSAVIEYSTDLYEADSIVRMLHNYISLLGDIVKYPENPLSQISILSEHEQQTLDKWRSGVTKQPDKEHTIHGLFEQQAENYPDSIALTFKEQQMTYKELNDTANRIARQLQQNHIKRGSYVGLCVNRSIEMIVGMLAVLKCGAAYVPLDPLQPSDRLTTIIENANLDCLVTDHASFGLLHIPSQVPLMYLDDIDRIGIQLEGNLDALVTGIDSAYIIYTSGSTGVPNGVLVNHSNVINVTLAAIEEFGIQHNSRVCQFATISFDASVYQIFSALLSGATLCIVSREEQIMISDLKEMICKNEVEFGDLPPIILEMLEPEDVPSLRTIATGGERCQHKLAVKWSNNRTFYNVYGPTETTVASIWFGMKNVQQDNHNSVPIGRPIANTDVYILDDEFNPVPIGAQGEIYIAGHGVAMGYHLNPSLTAARFVPNPFSLHGERMYKTGDKGRYLVDGNIEHLGRNDLQVKIRGFRIELEEIEIALHSHDSIKECVASIVDNQQNQKHILAHVVLQEGASYEEAEIVSFLRLKLPDYMVPTSIIEIASIPRLPNLKVDRKKLSSYPKLNQREKKKTVALSPEEIQVSQIWGSILNIAPESIGIYDNFFKLGGHSLLATMMLSRLNEKFNVNIPLHEVFQSLTIHFLIQTIVNHKFSDISDEELLLLMNEIEGIET
ncbi:amino acid adenylation domain-containing protein [Paenibacillus sp. MER 180]|uniref:non-ribosomal peptide synthetase n=1 Tax=Paenibacillus sp. MER 180 TaxID=2939570 RepID=UPI00203A7683|nr:non-ribosomal peptide synthetase [Paenibacillus sp. MER 180]MCM3291598.1 amino acid adenylation domain-containing protein [Paenibacillus sp. MER 180]